MSKSVFLPAQTCATESNLPSSEQFVLPSLENPLQPPTFIEAPPQHVPLTGLLPVLRPFQAMPGEFSATLCHPCTPQSGDPQLGLDEGEESAIELVARPQDPPSLDYQVNYPIPFFTLAEP